MTKFIKLTNCLLNTNHIHKIVIQSNKYYIHIANCKINGFNWGIGGFSFGNIFSYSSEIEVCEKKHSIDYKIVTQWISKNE